MTTTLEKLELEFNGRYNNVKFLSLSVTPSELTFDRKLPMPTAPTRPLWVVDLLVTEPVVKPEVPAGWPPFEAPASVVTPEGVRQVGGARCSTVTELLDRQLSMEAMRGMGPLGGTTSTAEENERYGMGGGWQCPVCGTRHPPDPCIPGAYL